MYRDEMEALRARINTLEAQLVAERRGREAAEASAFASRAALEEQRRFKDSPDAVSPAQTLRAWPLAMVVVFSTVSCLFLGMQWSHQWHRSERFERMLILSSRHQRHPTLRAPRGVVSRRSWVPNPVRIRPTIVPSSSPSPSPTSSSPRILSKGSSPVPSASRDVDALDDVDDVGALDALGDLDDILVAAASRNPPPARARLASILSREQRRTRKALKVCLYRELDRQASRKEGERLLRLGLHVELRANGTVSKATVKAKTTATGTASEAMAACVAKVAKGWRFPAARGMAKRRFTFPMVFRSVAVH